jgi:DNA-binding XRE family transcriptional regulator
MTANEKRLVPHEIAQRLDDLEAARHLTQREVAAGIGMIEQTYSNKKNGLRPFSAKDYKALADFFDTSVDYLMGRTLDPWPVDNPPPTGRGGGMKVKDRYWEVENSIRFANPEKATRPLLCGPKVSEDGVRIRLWLRNLAEGTGAGGAIVLLSRHEAAVLANAINTRSNWIGEKTSDMPRIGVSVTETSTIIRFMECGGAGHIALPLADGERLASCLHDMADGCWRAHCGYVPEAAK